MNRECQKSQSCAAYAARSRRLARRALMIRIASASPLLLNVYATMSTCPRADRPIRRKSRLRRRMPQVRAVERLGIEKDSHGVIERDAVLRRVALGVARIPLEHAFSIYEMHEPAGAPCSIRVPLHAESYAVNSIRSCVRTVSDTPRHPGQTPWFTGILRRTPVLREVVDGRCVGAFRYASERAAGCTKQAGTTRSAAALLPHLVFKAPPCKKVPAPLY